MVALILAVSLPALLVGVVGLLQLRGLEREARGDVRHSYLRDALKRRDREAGR